MVASGRGMCGGRKLLSGPLEVGDGAREAEACGAIGVVRNLSHIVPFQGVQLPSRGGLDAFGVSYLFVCGTTRIGRRVRSEWRVSLARQRERADEHGNPSRKKIQLESNWRVESGSEATGYISCLLRISARTLVVIFSIFGRISRVL